MSSGRAIQMGGRITSMPRYVILRHEFPSGHPRGSHWDLMLEVNAVLKTWALSSLPAVGCQLEALQLPDHRLEYLDYEGDVSRDRGRVQRVDCGTYALESETPRTIAAIMKGTLWHARAWLERNDVLDQRWNLSLFDV